MYKRQRFDVVVRYQGGGNAGHTVINDMGKFALHLLPSGVFHKGVMNILGNGVALDCENLLSEIETLRAAGVPVSPENLLVSDRASLLLPWHRELDALEEARLKDKQYGLSLIHISGSFCRHQRGHSAAICLPHSQSRPPRDTELRTGTLQSFFFS